MRSRNHSLDGFEQDGRMKLKSGVGNTRFFLSVGIHLYLLSENMRIYDNFMLDIILFPIVRRYPHLWAPTVGVGRKSQGWVGARAVSGVDSESGRCWK